jgi:hypothetical protein
VCAERPALIPRHGYYTSDDYFQYLVRLGAVPGLLQLSRVGFPSSSVSRRLPHNPRQRVSHLRACHGRIKDIFPPAQFYAVMISNGEFGRFGTDGFNPIYSHGCMNYFTRDNVEFHDSNKKNLAISSYCDSYRLAVCFEAVE